MRFSVDKKITLPLRLAGIFLVLSVACFVGAKRESEKKYKPETGGGYSDVRLQKAHNTENPFEYRLASLMPGFKNYVFSPLGVKSALMLAANGTDGDTQKEILTALGYDGLTAANAAFENISQKASDKLSLSMWINTDSVPKDLQSKFGQLNGLYGAEVNRVNNLNARGKISKWCKNATNGRSPLTVDGKDFDISVVSAVYFNEKWEEPFDRHNTGSGVFRQEGGERYNTAFMHGEFIARLYEDADVKILEKRYADCPYAMYFALNADDMNDENIDIGKYLDKFSGEYDEEKFRSGDDPDFMWYEVGVAIPSFEISCIQDIVPKLKEMGINAAFDRTKPIYTDSMLQTCTIRVDEGGTAASAVTEVNEEVAAVPEKTFTADRPFTFCIADTETHEILFLGEFMGYL